MSLRDLVICTGSATTTAAGVLTITNAAISAGDVAIGAFSTAVGTPSAAVQLRCVCAAGQAVFTAVDAAGAAVAVAVGVDFLIVKLMLGAVGSG
jgi:hypothetical protein